MFLNVCLSAYCIFKCCICAFILSKDLNNSSITSCRDAFQDVWSFLNWESIFFLPPYNCSSYRGLISPSSGIMTLIFIKSKKTCCYCYLIQFYRQVWQPAIHWFKIKQHYHKSLQSRPSVGGIHLLMSELLDKCGGCIGNDLSCFQSRCEFSALVSSSKTYLAGIWGSSMLKKLRALRFLYSHA